MTTNGEWLFSKPFDEQVAWMHEEHQDGGLDGGTAALNAKIAYPMHNGYKGVKADMVIFDELHDEHDSRDKLEADVRKIAEAYNMDTQRHGTERFAHELYYSIIHLLDRQAAITEREVCAFIRGKDAEHDERIHRVAELQQQVDELAAERDKLQEKLRIGWECECRLQAERERYREKFGKCIDYADAIHALMDDEGMA